MFSYANENNYKKTSPTHLNTHTHTQTLIAQALKDKMNKYLDLIYLNSIQFKVISDNITPMKK